MVKRGHEAALAQVKRALEQKAIEIGGHVRNINDAAAMVLHILQTSLQVPGSSSLPHTLKQWCDIEAVRLTINICSVCYHRLNESFNLPEGARNGERHSQTFVHKRSTNKWYCIDLLLLVTQC